MGSIRPHDPQHAVPRVSGAKVDQVAWCLDAEGCTSIREGLGCLFRGGRRLGERVLYPRWSSHQDTAGCRFHREAHTTAGLIGIKVWICTKDDFQPARSGTRRRSNATNA